MKRLKLRKGISIAYLNINSIRNKIELLKPTILETVDILVIAETKLDNTFATNQFTINGFNPPLRYDRNKNGGGLLIYIREGVPAKQLKDFTTPDDIECGIIEVNLHKKKWILFGTYRPPSQNVSYFLDELGKAIDHYSSHCENFIALGDFNIGVEHQKMKSFMEIFHLKNLIKVPTCFKSDNPKCIDLILTNKHHSFQESSAIDTGLSDFHSMIVTILKGGFVKRGPKIIIYRDYKKFDVNTFRHDLEDSLSEMNTRVINFSEFNERVETVLNEHAPIKKKCIRANDGPFMTKALRKAIYTRTSLRNRYNKNRTQENWNAFKRQRNKCVKLLRQAKIDYYKNLDVKCLTDNRKFWKTIKPLFSEKIKASPKINLLENEVLVTDDREVANIFNEYFISITEVLGIQEPKDILKPIEGLHDPIEVAIKKFSSHPSIELIYKNKKSSNEFRFTMVVRERVATEIQKLKLNKASPVDSIPGKILKDNQDIFTNALQKLFNDSVIDGTFPPELKIGEITPVYKANDQTLKSNYRPITILSAISKIYERLMFEQVMAYSESFLFQYLCGFRKGYNTQQALVRFLEKCKAVLDNKGFAGAILMDLSKAFDCLNHDLLIAKLHAYGFNRTALKQVHSYLTDRQQRVKINGSFSTLKCSSLGVPQGSVLGPLLFNIYINDFFYLVKDTEVCNYADDTTIFVCGTELDPILKSLEKDASLLTSWFANNYMKMNGDKSHLLMFGNKSAEATVNISRSSIKESDEEKLLGVTIDKKLNFKSHVNSLCKKASQKLHALARISTYMEKPQLELTITTFIMSHFSYCPLVWMFHDRASNNKINKIHERALRIIHKDSTSNFQELLNKSNSVSVHQRNLQLLLTEIYKTVHNLNPTFMTQVFEKKDVSYNLRESNSLTLPKANTTLYGIDTVRYIGKKLWQVLPTEIKESKSLEVFKKKIKLIKNFDCSCRLCKNFVPSLGFV